MVKVICKICGKQCKGEVLKLQDNFFHIACFQCTECKKALANESFFTHEGRYYCEKDYAKKFGASCAACGRIVDDSSRAVAALGKTFHEPCFRCSRCGCNFKPGDKVSLAAGEHLCSRCVAGFTGQPRQTGRHVGQPMTTSTPLDKQHRATSQTHAAPPPTKTVEKSMGYVSGPEGVDSLGVSDAEDQELLDNNQQPLRYPSPLSGDETFSELSASRQLSPKPTRGVGDGANRTLPNDGSRYSTKNQTAQFEPKFRSTFGQHLTGSYMQHGMSYLRRAGSMPPGGAPPQAVAPPTVRSPHFSRPENFSYRHPTKRFVRAKKGGLVQLMEFSARAASDKAAAQIKEEAIKLSHYANGRAPTPQDLPAIERDDFPAPPASVNVIGHHLRSKEGLEEEEKATDPKLARDLDQLELLAKDHSGVAEIILRDLQNRMAHSGILDPRSASRTPAANHEPGIPTRYMSAMFASPSRFSDHPRSARFFSTPPPGEGDTDLHGATMPPGLSLSTSNKLGTIDPKSSTLPVGALAQGDGVVHGERSKSPYKSDTSLDADNILYYKTHYRAATLSDVCPTYLSEQAGLKHSLGQLPPAHQPAQVFSYDVLKGGPANKSLPKNVNLQNLEVHLNNEEFERIFHMPRDVFYRQPEWKQNDMKQRAALF